MEPIIQSSAPHLGRYVRDSAAPQNLRRAARLDLHNALVLYTDELAHFDLPTDPDGPDEQLESLLGRLAFV